MGRKVHPIGFRLKITRDWDARWFATGREYADLLHEDLAIRRLIAAESTRAGVSRIEIERKSQQVFINIHTARPGIIIGRKGESVKRLRAALQQLTGKTVRVEVTEIEKPDLDATLVAQNVAGQLERRIGHSRAMKRVSAQVMRSGGQGVKIMVAGRLSGADMSRREWTSEGRIPRSTLRADIDYGTAEARTTFGCLGVKVWIYRGEVLSDSFANYGGGEKQDVYVSR